MTCAYCETNRRKQRGGAGTCNWTKEPHCEGCCSSICEPCWKPSPVVEKKVEKKVETERFDKSWRLAAKCDLESGAYQIQKAIAYLGGENDYFAQVHGYSALKFVSEALANVAAAVERGRTQER